LVTELVRAGSVVVMLSAGHGLVTLALIQLSTLVVRGIAYRVGTRFLEPQLTVAVSLFHKETCLDIIRFSTVTTILHASGMIIFNSDAFVISLLMPVAQVGFFTIGGNLTQAALQVLGGVSRALYPLVSARQAVEGLAAARGLMRDSLRLTTIVIL